MQNVDRFGKRLQLDVLVKDCLRRGSNIEQVSAALTQRVKQHCPKWNWTVLCGQDFETCRHADNWHEVMFCQEFEDKLRVIIIRGSPLDKYEGGPANLAIVKEALPKPERDLRAIKRAVETSDGSCDRIVTNIKRYFSEQYPSENVVVIAGEDFALSQQFDELASLIFCAAVGQISIIIVLADKQKKQ